MVKLRHLFGVLVSLVMLADIYRVEGIMHKMDMSDAEGVATFKHGAPDSGMVLRLSTVAHALGKIGIAV